ncbi:arabinogalactan endo-1,4-beta-galactosidase [Marinifilum breve]|uniref:Arabinogalactan endo-beta-1,4-galactanase n=1 Tax=Marinifilum breve TaxID=2184082 RepID=A0A2V3ZZL7_9BACT|nr:glycosyl hydrolase 53 family protein [Marinifilum breve]PXY00997.1 arabinogalactan endo-1,4-beta-galactosidase [Marinifilum breve]
MKQITLHIIFLIILLSSCSKSESETILPTEENGFIKGADLSFLPQLEELSIPFYDKGVQSDVLNILKNQGMNTVRLRLWHTPQNSNSSFNEVKKFAELIKTQNLNLWLSIHYSDTWADPAHQQIPEAWKNLNFETLKDSVYNYTSKIVREIKPDYIQIGNEINPGILLPVGDRFEQIEQFKELLSIGINAVRDTDPNCKIMVHHAGYSNAESFYNDLKQLDFDIMALSYYPIWHGKSLSELKSSINHLQTQFLKPVIIAETAYPFTLDWNDWTNNIVGQEDQLILPNYPATSEGQKKYLLKIKDICNEVDALGFCYWGAEYVAFDGDESKNGSSWENQALFDFNNELLPAAEAFN